MPPPSDRPPAKRQKSQLASLSFPLDVFRARIHLAFANIDGQLMIFSTYFFSSASAAESAPPPGNDTDSDDEDGFHKSARAAGKKRKQPQEEEGKRRKVRDTRFPENRHLKKIICFSSMSAWARTSRRRAEEIRQTRKGRMRKTERKRRKTRTKVSDRGFFY